MKNLTIKLIARILLPFTLLSPFLQYAFYGHHVEKQVVEEVQRYDVSFELPVMDEPIEIHSRKQMKYMTNILRGDTTNVNGKNEYSRPDPVELWWYVTADENVVFDEYTVSLSTNEDMTDAREYVFNDTDVKIPNLYIATDYYWTVSAEFEGVTYTSDVATFTVSDSVPRNLKVDGVTNVRDLGGYTTSDGGTVRQGLLYRTGRLHTDGGVEIKEAGIKTMLEDLGVKTEIDLRSEIKETEYGALGESVNYIVIPMDFDRDILLKSPEKIREFFSILANEDNYPIFFHCYIGTDRTGACAFLVNALLGVKYSDLKIDYLFSNFASIGGPRSDDDIGHYSRILSRYEGESFADKTRSYLLSIGVTEEELDSIISILKEN